MLWLLSHESILYAKVGMCGVQKRASKHMQAQNYNTVGEWTQMTQADPNTLSLLIAQD